MYSQREEERQASLREAELLAERVAPDDVCYHDARIPWGSVYDGKQLEERLKELIQVPTVLDDPEDSDSRRKFYREKLKPRFVDEYYRNCCSPYECRICNDPKVSCYHETWGVGDICPSTTRGSP